MKTKLIFIWIGVVLLVGMCLYPPWHIKTKISVKITGIDLESLDERILGILKGNERKPLKHYKYDFLFSPAKKEFETISDKTNIEGKGKINKSVSYTTKIDLTRLGLQFLAVFPLLGAMYITLSFLGKNKELEQSRKAAKAKEFEEENDYEDFIL